MLFPHSTRFLGFLSLIFVLQFYSCTPPRVRESSLESIRHTVTTASSSSSTLGSNVDGRTLTGPKAFKYPRIPKLCWGCSSFPHSQVSNRPRELERLKRKWGAVTTEFLSLKDGFGEPESSHVDTAQATHLENIPTVFQAVEKLLELKEKELQTFGQEETPSLHLWAGQATRRQEQSTVQVIIDCLLQAPKLLAQSHAETGGMSYERLEGILATLNYLFKHELVPSEELLSIFDTEEIMELVASHFHEKARAPLERSLSFIRSLPEFLRNDARTQYFRNAFFALEDTQWRTLLHLLISKDYLYLSSHGSLVFVDWGPNQGFLSNNFFKGLSSSQSKLVESVIRLLLENFGQQKTTPGMPDFGQLFHQTSNSYHMLSFALNYASTKVRTRVNGESATETSEKLQLMAQVLELVSLCSNYQKLVSKSYQTLMTLKLADNYITANHQRIERTEQNLAMKYYASLSHSPYTFRYRASNQKIFSVKPIAVSNYLKGDSSVFSQRTEELFEKVVSLRSYVEHLKESSNLVPWIYGDAYVFISYIEKCSVWAM